MLLWISVIARVCLSVFGMPVKLLLSQITPASPLFFAHCQQILSASPGH